MTWMLFVEDDPDDAFLIGRALERAGVTASFAFAGSAREALARLEGAAAESQRLPAVTFTDLNMPGMSGFDLLRRMREHAVLRVLPVVVLSSSSSPRDLREACEAGANAYMVKPVALDEFAAMLGAAERFWTRCNRTVQR